MNDAEVLLYVVGAIVVLSARQHTVRRAAFGAALGIAVTGLLFTSIEVYRMWFL